MPWDGDPPQHGQAHLDLDLDLDLDPCLGHELQHLDLLNEFLYPDQMKESLVWQPRRNETHRLNITITNISQVLHFVKLDKLLYNLTSYSNNAL